MSKQLALSVIEGGGFRASAIFLDTLRPRADDGVVAERRHMGPAADGRHRRVTMRTLLIMLLVSMLAGCSRAKPPQASDTAQTVSPGAPVKAVEVTSDPRQELD